MSVYTEYGDFKNEKALRDHLKKLDDLRQEGNWNGWLLLSPPRSFVVWRSTNSSHAVVLYKTTNDADGLRHWQVTVNAKGQLRVTQDATSRGVEQTIKRRERDGVTFDLTMTRTPPDVLNKLDWLDPACLALRDYLHSDNHNLAFDVQTCFRRDCDQPGVYRRDDDPRPWYWYMLCDEHRPDTLDPRNPTAKLQTTVRRKGKRVHVEHRVRSNENGGTPGPTLCGMERFGPDRTIHGFSVGGGVSGPGVTIEVCQACIEGEELLRQSAEFLDRRVRWLERQSQKDRAAWAQEKEQLLDVQSRRVAELSQLQQRFDQLQKLSNEDAENIEGHARELDIALTKVAFGKAIAQALLDNYARMMGRLGEYDAEFISRFIGYTEATFEDVLAKAKEITDAT